MVQDEGTKSGKMWDILKPNSFILYSEMFSPICKDKHDWSNHIKTSSNCVWVWIWCSKLDSQVNDYIHNNEIMLSIKINPYNIKINEIMTLKKSPLRISDGIDEACR